MLRMTEPQVRDLVAGIECPTRVIFADPAQPYLPDALRRERAGLLPRGELVVMTAATTCTWRTRRGGRGDRRFPDSACAAIEPRASRG